MSAILGALPEDYHYLVDLARQPTRLKYIYEPLNKVIQDEDLRPYCCYLRTVAFYYWYDSRFHHTVEETEHEWLAGQQVISDDGQRYDLLSARCVYVRGQWCMRWLARRVGPEETQTHEASHRVEETHYTKASHRKQETHFPKAPKASQN